MICLLAESAKRKSRAINDVGATVLHIRDVSVFPRMEKYFAVDALHTVMDLPTHFFHFRSDSTFLQEAFIWDMNKSCFS